MKQASPWPSGGHPDRRDPARLPSAAVWSLAAILLLGFGLLRGSGSLLAKEGQGARIDIIRGLQSEIAVAKVPLPRGKHGVYLSSDGQLDRARAETELKENGAAVGAGAPAEITKVSFKSDEVRFEINHGGKSGMHWYQHIEVGVGTATSPIGPVNPADSTILAYGSYISLKIPGKISELTVPEVKKLLGSVLDFERHSPTVLYAPTTPPKFKEAIKKHEVVVGMDHDSVLSAKGPPDRKVRETHEDGSEEEDWIYGTPPHVLFVVFDGDQVTSVKQY